MSYIFICQKCGSIEPFIEIKGTAKGLYCSDCGAWQKWLGKDEYNAVSHYLKVKEK